MKTFFKRMFFIMLFFIMLYGALIQFYQGVNVRKIINAPEIVNNIDNKIYVAIIDTGFDVNHPAYKDKISIKYRYSTDDSNDIREIPVYESGKYSLTHHGTHIVGILCGQLGKRLLGKRLSGKRPSGKKNEVESSSENIHSVEKVSTNNYTYAFQGVATHVVPILIQILPYSSTEEIKKAFDYVKNTPAQIVSISMSFGQNNEGNAKPIPYDIASSILSLTNAGKIVLLSAGNSGQYLEANTYTQSLLSLMQYTQGRLILVGATDHTCSLINQNKLANFSNRPYSFYAGQNFICAPGVNIRSSITHPFFETQLLSGTSMATPIIAGALAHIMLKFTDPDLAIQQLYKYARKINVHFGQGIVDLSFLKKIN